MKLSFKMTAQDYYNVWKIKLNKMDSINKKLKLLIVPLIMWLFCIILFILIKQYMFAGYFTVFIAGILCFFFSMRKNSIIKQYHQTAVVKSIHTICTYNDGLEIINSYEKIFVPWQSLYYVKNTEKYLFILPTFRKGAFAVDKSKQNADAIDELIRIIKEHIAVEEGK